MRSVLQVHRQPGEKQQVFHESAGNWSEHDAHVLNKLSAELFWPADGKMSVPAIVRDERQHVVF